jgi:hypothetical protein
MQLANVTKKKKKEKEKKERKKKERKEKKKKAFSVARGFASTGPCD